MAGDGIRITAALREKFNAYVGAEVLAKEDEGLTLIDADGTGQVDSAGQSEWGRILVRRGDGLIGIQYPDNYEKLIAVDGSVVAFNCLPMGTGHRNTPCGDRSIRPINLMRNGRPAKIDPEKMTLAVMSLLGTQSIPKHRLQKMDTAHIRSAKLYFQAFTQPPPATNPYDGPSGQEGDCR